MGIITKKSENSNNFFLQFHFYGEGHEFLDNNLPIPHHHKHWSGKGGYSIGWWVEGYFATKTGQDYLNDVIARVLITFKDLKPTRLPYKPNDKNIYLARAIKLKEISRQLDSVKTKKYAPERADKYADSVFWSIKLYIEDYITDTGFIAYSVLESWALSNFIEHKDRSTIRSKCKNIWNWYDNQNWEIRNRRKLSEGELMATRTENMKKINQQRETDTQLKILETIKYLRNENIKIMRKNIVEHSGLSKTTVTKYSELWKKKKESK